MRHRVSVRLSSAFSCLLQRHAEDEEEHSAKPERASPGKLLLSHSTSCDIPGGMAYKFATINLESPRA